MKKQIIPLLFILIVFVNVPINQVEGHSGGTDKNGCHAGSQAYHCHNGSNNSSSSGGDPSLMIILFIIVMIIVCIIILSRPKCDHCGFSNAVGATICYKCKKEMNS